MLRALRDGAKSGFLKYILLGLLVLAAGGLILMDVGGFFRGGTTSTTVAVVGKNTIEAREFDRSVRRVLSAQGIDAPTAHRLGLINMILRSQIQNHVIFQEARKLGLMVGDSQVKEQIAKIAESFIDDTTSKRDAMRQILRSQGFTEKAFIQSIRQEMVQSLLSGTISSSLALSSDQLLYDLYAFEQEKRDIEAILLEEKTIKDIPAPTKEQLEQLYQARRGDYLIPEVRTITIATLKKEMIEHSVQIEEEELRATYEDSITAFEKPEKRLVDQAVFVEQQDAQSVVSALEKKAGKPILEKTIKNVTGNTDAYMGSQEFEQSGLLEDIATPVFAAEKQTVIGPIQSELGWHVLVVQDILPPYTQSFEEVKEDLHDELLQESLFEELLEMANLIDDRLASGDTLETVIQETGLTKEVLGPLRASGQNKEGKDLLEVYGSDKGQIIDTSFDLEEGEISPVLEMLDGRFLVVRADAITPQSFKAFEKVTEDLKKRWVSSQKATRNRLRAQEAMRLAKEQGESLQALAKKYASKVRSFKNLERSQDAPKPLDPSALNTFFGTKIGEYALAKAESGWILAKVKTARLPKDNLISQKDGKSLDDLRLNTLRSLSDEAASLYLTSLQGKYPLKINEDLLSSMYAGAEQ